MDVLLRLDPALKAALLLVLLGAGVAGGLRTGTALCLGAVLLAAAWRMDVEAFANALNHGTTGVPTVRMIAALIALAWLAEVLRETRAPGRLGEALSGRIPDGRAREALRAALEGLFPAGTAEGDDPAGLWFRRLARAALPLGAGFLVACELWRIPLARGAAVLSPLAFAMAAVGLLLLARELPAPPDGAPPGSRGGWRDAAPLLACAASLAVALALPDTRVPEVRSSSVLVRLGEGLLGLLPPAALGASLGALLAARAGGLGAGPALACLRRAARTETVLLAVGLEVFLRISQAVPGRDLLQLHGIGPEWLGLALLAGPALAAALLGDAGAGLAMAAPFLLPDGQVRTGLLLLAFGGAHLGEAFSPRRTTSADARWRLAVPSAVSAALAAFLALG